MNNLSEELKAKILDTVRGMLDHPTCRAHFARGVREYTDDGVWVRHEPTDGRTLTIEVHGGARTVCDYR